MTNIDFTPTAYTVKNPADGKPCRYDGNDFRQADGEQEYRRMTESYPNMARFVVPDHFVQEYCRSFDASCWSGSGGRNVDSVRIFTRLAETGLGQAKFS